MPVKIIVFMINLLFVIGLSSSHAADPEKAWRDDNSPSWSPDGKKIAYAVVTDSSQTILKLQLLHHQADLSVICI